MRFGQGEAVQQSPITMLEMRAVVTGCTVVTGSDGMRFGQGEATQQWPIAMLAMRAVVKGCMGSLAPLRPGGGDETGRDGWRRHEVWAG